VALHYYVGLYFAFALVHDSRGKLIEIVNFTISLALSAGTLMASAGTRYRLVPAHFYPWSTQFGSPMGNFLGGKSHPKMSGINVEVSSSYWRYQANKICLIVGYE